MDLIGFAAPRRLRERVAAVDLRKLASPRSDGVLIVRTRPIPEIHEIVEAWRGVVPGGIADRVVDDARDWEVERRVEEALLASRAPQVIQSFLEAT